jgi:RNA repair, ligase-Pnkp-associating, region of Hen1
MFLSIATTYQPATDLGYLLHKHLGRLHEIEQTFGKAWVFDPDASDGRCEAALVLDVDPVGLVRGKGQAQGLIRPNHFCRFAYSNTGSCAAAVCFNGAAIAKSARVNLAVEILTAHVTLYPYPSSCPHRTSK